MLTQPHSRGPARPASTLAMALAMVFLHGMSHAASPCPANRIVLTASPNVLVDVTTTKASLDTSAAFTHGAYDLVSGALECDVSFYDVGGPNFAISSVDTEDDYWVVGPAPGTPIDFSAELSLSGSWNVFPGVPEGQFSVEAFVAVGGDTARYAIPGGCCHGNFIQVISLPLHQTAYEPFRLHLHMSSRDYRGRVTLTGQLQFTGLPAGAGVSSCQNSPVTTTRSLTWGQMKIRYR